MRIIIIILILLNFNASAFSDNNYYISNFNKPNLKNLKKKWIYRSNIFKDTQTRPKIYKDNVIFLDGFKNLRVLSLYDGKEITFDLLAVKPKFDLKRDMTISSKKTFNRRVKF